MEEADFYGEGPFLRRRLISTEEGISMQQAYTCMENRNNFTEEASFYSGRCLFSSVQQ